MAENDLTVAELAAALGVSDELVRLWKNGQRPISAKRAIAISKAIGVPRDQLRPDLWEPSTPFAAPPAPKTDTPKRRSKRKPAPVTAPEAEAAPEPEKAA